MKLSLIIPVYNVEKYIECCLTSCFNQNISSSEYEIIIINDGTQDRSLEIAESVAKEYSNTIIISQSNAGLSAARNKGLSLAKGEYVWFIDSDDWIKENCLQHVITLCLKHKLDILTFSAANKINGSLERRFDKPELDLIIHTGRDFLLNDYQATCVPFSIYKRSFLLENNLLFYVGIFHEDSEFTPRAYYFANIVMYINDILYFVQPNPTSITRTVNPQKQHDIIKVCQSLHLFCNQVDNKDQVIFHNKIGLNINNSLFESYKLSPSEKKALNKAWACNKNLMKHLLLSNILKYRLEGLIFILFGGDNYIKTYQFIQQYNRKNKTRSK